MNFFHRINLAFIHNDYGYLGEPYDVGNSECVVTWASMLTTTVAAIHFGMRPNANVITASALAIFYGSLASILAINPRVFFVSVGTVSVVCASRLLAKSVEG